MGLVATIAHNLGLLTLSLLALALTVYLLYIMVHPERF